MCARVPFASTSPSSPYPIPLVRTMYAECSGDSATDWSVWLCRTMATQSFYLFNSPLCRTPSWAISLSRTTYHHPTMTAPSPSPPYRKRPNKYSGFGRHSNWIEFYLFRANIELQSCHVNTVTILLQYTGCSDIYSTHTHTPKDYSEASERFRWFDMA